MQPGLAKALTGMALSKPTTVVVRGLNRQVALGSAGSKNVTIESEKKVCLEACRASTSFGANGLGVSFQLRSNTMHWKGA